MSKIKLFQSDRVWATIKEEVFDLVDQAHQRGESQNGELTKQLESELCRRFNRGYCITTACATDALDIALQSLQLPIHSNVIVPNYTFTATAHAVARAGHQVAAVDVGNNYCINIDKIRNASAIVSVDLFGNMCNYSMLYKTQLPIVVDAAQSLESIDHDNIASPSHGVLSCVSFSPSKTISSWGSGGAILTDDAVLAERCRNLRLHGKQTNKNIAIAAGLNSMMSSFECAAVLVGLRYSKQWQQRRKEIANYLISATDLIPSVDHIPQHTLSKLVFQSTDRNQVVQKLNCLDIETAVHYNLLINDETIYSSSGDLSNSNRLKSISFTVPNQHSLSDNEVETIAKGLK